MSRTLMAPRWGSGTVLAGALALALAVLAAVCLAPRADAAFTVGKCAGTTFKANGASFARDAHNLVFLPQFKDIFCADTPNAGALAPGMEYNANGSGAGREAMMDRGTESRFGGTDEPPTAADIQKMNTGVGKNGNPAADPDPSDNGQIHVIPAAIGAIAPLVNFPDNCEVTDLPGGATGQRTEEQNVTTAPLTAAPDEVIRIRFTREQFEGIWSGAAGFKTWNQVFPALNAHCSNEKITRVVRFDNSGSTFALKDYLNALDPTEGWSEDYTFGDDDTRAWPNAADVGPREDCPKVPAPPPAAPGTMVYPVGPGADSDDPLEAGDDQLTSGCAEGGGQMATKVNNTDGSVGYADISTARNANPSFAITPEANDNDKYWTQLPDGSAGDGVFREPTSDPNGFRTDGTKGANCAGAQFRNGTGGAPLPSTLGIWAQVSGVNSPNAFATCTLTYGLVFDDNADVWDDSDAEERKARTVKDYWTNVVSVPTQASLASRDYAALPASILAIAQAGVASIDWNKGPGGGGPGGGDDKGGGGGDDKGGGNPLPIVPLSNKFSVLRKSISSKTGGATISVKVPGAGKLEMIGTAKVGKKTIRVGRTVLNAGRAGSFNLALKPSAAAKKQLRKKGSLRISLKLTFTPAGGTASSSNTGLTLKLNKKKGK